jgi:hypothetical protein
MSAVRAFQAHVNLTLHKLPFLALAQQPYELIEDPLVRVAEVAAGTSLRCLFVMPT